MTQPNDKESMLSIGKNDKKSLYEIGHVNKEKIFYSPDLNRFYRLDKDDFDLKRRMEKLESKSFVPMEISLSKNEEGGREKITIFLTTACNLRCVYCYGFGGKNPAFIDFNFIKAQIDDYANSNTKKLSVFFQGTGEPTLSFDLIKKTVRYARTKIDDVNFQIQSNGIVKENVLNWLIGNKFSFIISCDGPPDIQNKQRPPLNKNDVGTVEKTIKKLIESNCLAAIRGTVTNYSSKRMIEILEYFHNLGVKTIDLEPVFLEGRASERKSAYSRMVNFDEYEKNLLKSCELIEEYEMVFENGYIRPAGVNKRFCGFPHRVLTTDGHIVSCLDYTPEKDNPQEFVYGDYDQKTNKIVINQKKLMNCKKISVENMPDCLDCFLKSSCGGWCFISNYYKTGSPLKPDRFRCKVIRNTTKKYLIYKIKKHLVQIKPYIYKANKKFLFSMFFNEFEMKKTDGQHLKGNPFIRINLKKTNLVNLAKKIIAYKKSRINKPTLFLISFSFQEKDLTTKNGKAIISFLDNLKENKIFFKLTRPLPFCIMPKNINVQNYNFPRSCKDCLELFIVKRNNLFNYCTKSGYRNLKKFSNRNEIFEEFKRSSNPKFLKKCMYCINAIRGNCSRVCCQ